jgi:hypothetical protein
MPVFIDIADDNVMLKLINDDEKKSMKGLS